MTEPESVGQGDEQEEFAVEGSPTDRADRIADIGRLISGFGRNTRMALNSGVEGMSRAVLPVRGANEQATDIVHGHGRFLRVCAALEGIGSTVEDEAHLIADLVEDGDLKSALAAGAEAFDYWQKHGGFAGMPFSRGPRVDDDFDVPDCPGCPACKPDTVIKVGDTMAGVDMAAILNLWELTGGTKDGFFDAVDALKKPAAEADKVAP